MQDKEERQVRCFPARTLVYHDVWETVRRLKPARVFIGNEQSHQIAACRWHIVNISINADFFLCPQSCFFSFYFHFVPFPGTPPLCLILTFAAQISMKT